MIPRRRLLQAGLAALTPAVGPAPARAQQGKRVVLLTPYQSAPVTNFLAQAIVKHGQADGWSASVIDTRGDMGQLVARLEDTVSAKAGAIVLVSVDTQQLKTQIAGAKTAGIPVFGCDTRFVDGMAASASSDDKAMARTIGTRLLGEIGHKGKVVVFTHRPHPGVLQRTQEFYALVKADPSVSVLVERHVEVPGPTESARQQMENILLANPAKGSIAGVWAAFDAAAVGAAQAVMAAGRTEIRITGVDGDAQAVALIQQKSPLFATMKQDFQAIADTVAESITRTLAGRPPEARQIDVPALLITADAAGR